MFYVPVVQQVALDYVPLRNDHSVFFDILIKKIEIQAVNYERDRQHFMLNGLKPYLETDI